MAIYCIGEKNLDSDLLFCTGEFYCLIVEICKNESLK